MRVICKQFSTSGERIDLLSVPVFEGKSPDSTLRTLDRIWGGQLVGIVKRGIFSGRKSQTFEQVPTDRTTPKLIQLIGLGGKAEFTVNHLRRAAGLAGKRATNEKIKTAGIILPAIKPKDGNYDAMVHAAVEGFLLGGYYLDKFKSKTDGKTPARRLTLLLPSGIKIAAAQQAAQKGLIYAESQNYCRNLATYPANYLTPNRLASEARALGHKYGFRVQVYNHAQIEKLKMGAFLAVANASSQPEKLIQLDYKPKRKAKNKVVLVGKGITFDSGGISLKPSLKMGEMKGDMGGAGVVLCTTAAIARLGLPIQVTAIIPACENMPGGSAYRPGDVVTTCIGKTIEIVSTDAEGRLLLADGLGYATKLKPDYLIDVATLTGAAIVALGHVSAAVLGTSDYLIEKLKQASAATGEPIWQLPLWDEYEKQIKSSIADMKNSGGRPAGTITASRLLKHFTGGLPWAHIDIAGVDLEFDGYEFMPKGSTGFGVRLLTEMLDSL